MNISAKKKTGLHLTAVTFTAMLVCCAGILYDSAARAGDGLFDGDPFRGREVFAGKGCSGCHSVWGHGGDLGPDILVAVQGKTWYGLVGDFWNHTPRMIDEVAARGYPWPSLDDREMADVLTYLYYLRLFDDPGDAARGEVAWERLRCSGCHSLGGEGARRGSPLDRFSAYPSPAPLAKAMWNSGPRMQREQLRRGRDIPQFSGHEMAELQAYIRAEGVRPTREVELQRLPDPERGAQVYRQKGCGACHDHPDGTSPDITRSALAKTVSEITGLLWNHSYAMSAEMASQGISFPRFEEGELTDLTAHLFFLGYIGEEGDPASGRQIFLSKGCAECHQDSPTDGSVVMQTSSALSTRSGLAAAMWNHAPQMHDGMAEKSQSWPKFEPGEMRDLAAYLRSVKGTVVQPSVREVSP